MGEKSFSSEDWHRRFTQQARWTASVRKYLMEKAGAQPADQILEVGCGTGAVQKFLESEGYSVFGIDLNQAYLQYAQENQGANSQTVGDGYTLPYPANCFEIVYCHFLLLWVQDPVEILSEMIRVTKPGGNLLVFAEPDYGGRIDYPIPLEILGQLQKTSLQSQGADPYMGRKLAEMVSGFNLDEIEIGILGYQSTQDQPEEFWESEWQVLVHDLAGLIQTNELEHLIKIDQQAQQAGQRVLYVPTFYLYARKNCPPSQGQ